MGDILGQRLPNTGRIMLSQISAGSTIPISAILLLGLPYSPSAAPLYALVFIALGFFTSWNAPATNKYIYLQLSIELSFVGYDCKL